MAIAPAPSTPEDRPAALKPHRLIVLQNSSVFGSLGGIEYYTDEFVTLASEIYGTRSVCTVAPLGVREVARVTRGYEHHLISRSRNPWVRRLENRFSYRLFQKARSLAATLRPTLFICNHVSLAPTAYLLQRATGTPYLVIGHGVEIWGNLPPQDEWALRRAKGVLAVSEWTRRVLEERGYNGNRMAVVHTRLPQDFEALPFPDPKPNDGTPFTLLTVARMDARERYKGQDHVIEAIHRIRLSYNDHDLKLRYIIQGEGTDRPRLEAMVREKGLEDVVEFRGPVGDRTELAAVYREADVFIMPSLYGRWKRRWRGEGLGIVYLEAAACGVPSIAYDCGGVTDVITDGKDGVLVEQGDVGQLARSITLLARNPGRVAELGRNAYHMVRSRFTKEPIRRELTRALDRF